MSEKNRLTDIEEVDIPEGTIRILDDEAKATQAHREKISRVILELDQILLREELTMGDFLEIMGMFTERANKVFEKITIKDIKEKYDRST